MLFSEFQNRFWVSHYLNFSVTVFLFFFLSFILSFFLFTATADASSSSARRSTHSSRVAAVFGFSRSTRNRYKRVRNGCLLVKVSPSERWRRWLRGNGVKHPRKRKHLHLHTCLFMSRGQEATATSRAFLEAVPHFMSNISSLFPPIKARSTDSARVTSGGASGAASGAASKQFLNSEPFEGT